RIPGRSLRRGCNSLVARNAKQYLRANWSDHANRPGSEERDPYRRICQGRIREGETAARCRPRRCSPASSPDPDDVLCFYLRPSAALVCQWIRRRCPAHPRLYCDWRNDRRIGYRNLPYPSHVLRDRATVYAAKRENNGTASWRGAAEASTCASLAAWTRISSQH